MGDSRIECIRETGLAIPQGPSADLWTDGDYGFRIETEDHSWTIDGRHVLARVADHVRREKIALLEVATDWDILGLMEPSEPGL